MNTLQQKVGGALISMALAFPGGASLAASSYKPDALLSVDLNRSAVVEKIVSAWSNEISAAQRESFKSKLQGLRADHLLSANLSGSFEGVLEVLSAHEGANKISAIPAMQNGAVLSTISDKSKALGDGTADLVYTPITPCRLFDTRAGLASALGTVGGTFSNQQTKTIVPAGACGIPTTGVASVFFSFHAYTFNPSVLGVVGFMKPGTAFTALAATWTGANWLTGTFITNTNSDGSFDAFVGNGQAMTADMVVDVMGYFKAPGGTIGDITDIQTAAGSGLTGGVTSGAVSLSLANSYKLPQSCTNGQVPKSDGAGGWTCAADATVTNAWTQGGNAFGAPGVIGTNDAQPLTVQSGGGQISVLVPGGGGLRVLANLSGTNVINGDSSNTLGNANGNQRGVTVAGGTVNRGGSPDGAYGWYSTIGGGQGNKTGSDDSSGGDYATVAGGGQNHASGFGATVGGGRGNIASGSNSTVPGGFGNRATGDGSFAAGANARADQMFCSVFNLWRNTTITAGCAGLPSIFRVAASNGLTVDFGTPDVAGNGSDWVFIGPIFPGKHISAKSGAYLSSGGVWTNSSDQTKKEEFRDVDVHAVLRKVAALPVTTWNYIDEGKAIRRMGPMAQDFRNAFGLGLDNKSIGVVDADGVALAAIQGLNKKLDAQTMHSKAKDAKIATLERELAAIKKKLGL